MNTLKKMVAALSIMSSAALPVSAYAQSQSPVAISSEVKAVETSVDADGNVTTELVELGVTVPGDRLLFVNSYANNGEEPATNFVITNAVHQAVRLAPDADANLTVSVDGGESWGTLSQLSVVTEEGATRSATHADVTHIRWVIASIAPGESGSVDFPAIIR